MKALLLSVMLLGAPEDSLSRGSINADSLFIYINEYRESRGLTRLKRYAIGQPSTAAWARHISRKFVHYDRGNYICENIVMAYSQKQCFEQWRKSMAHNRNMLLPNITSMTVAVYVADFRGHRAHYGVMRGYKNKKATR